MTIVSTETNNLQFTVFVILPFDIELQDLLFSPVL